MLKIRGMVLLFLAAAGPSPALDYCIGADLSFLKQQEDGGMEFRDGGVESPALKIFRAHGYGWIRLRLFHTPANNPENLARPLPNDLPYTLDLAKRAKAEGMKLLLDFHYSDTWADPAKQFTPASWAGKTHAQLQDSVFAYTRSTLQAFRQAGVFPEMVQIGNEIIGGMLWPDGKTPDWKNLGELLKAGVRGVDSAAGGLVRPLVMLHLDRGGDSAGTRYWFDNILAQGVPFDVIGQSYYPQWHGTLRNLADNFAFMGGKYAKDIILVEVAYTTLADGTSPFPMTNEGQADFLDSVDRIVRAAPNGRGKGVMWWEPTASSGSRNLFDGSGNAKPAMKVFDKYITSNLPLRPKPAIATRSVPGSPGIRGGDSPVGADGRTLAEPARTVPYFRPGPKASICLQSVQPTCGP